MAEETGSQLSLPAIPDKRYFTIGEVSRLCALKSHVLRYWEQEIPQLKPTKRRGNRRYYQRHDVEMVRHIRDLLYAQGFTLEGARQQLAHQQAMPTECVISKQQITQLRTQVQSALDYLQN